LDIMTWPSADNSVNSCSFLENEIPVISLFAIWLLFYLNI
jgi:hypothetical protein